MNTPQKVSIVTIVYNGQDFLPQTIASVKAQTYPAVEYIIIDGNSSDNTLSIINENQAHITTWISEPDKGLYNAMNKGIAKATGDWICFLNAGDTFYQNTTLEKLFSRDLTDIDFLYGDSYLLTLEGKPVRLMKAETLTRSSISKGMIACHQTMFIRREKCPDYDESLVQMADLNWVIDILYSIPPNRILKTDVCVVYYLMGGVSESAFWSNFVDYLRLIKKRFGILTLIYRIPRMCRRLFNVYIKQGIFGIHTLRFWSKKADSK